MCSLKREVPSLHSRYLSSLTAAPFRSHAHAERSLRKFHHGAPILCVAFFRQHPITNITPGCYVGHTHAFLPYIGVGQDRTLSAF